MYVPCTVLHSRIKTSIGLSQINYRRLPAASRAINLLNGKRPIFCSIIYYVIDKLAQLKPCTRTVGNCHTWLFRSFSHHPVFPYLLILRTCGNSLLLTMSRRLQLHKSSIGIDFVHTMLLLVRRKLSRHENNISQLLFPQLHGHDPRPTHLSAYRAF